MKKYRIYDANGNVLVSFSWFNEDSYDAILPKFKKYIYENVVYLLLLSREVHDADDPDVRMDKTSYIEENLFFGDSCVLLELAGAFALDVAAIGEIEKRLDCRSGGSGGIDWEVVKDLANSALLKMDIPLSVSSEEYGKDHLSDDFLF